MFKAYDGSGYISLLNGHIHGELESTKINSIDKTIELTMTLFDSPDNVFADTTLRIINNGSFVEIFSNEDSNSLYRRYYNVTYIGMKSNNSIDCKNIKITYIFKYTCHDNLCRLKGNLVSMFIKEEESKYFGGKSECTSTKEQ